MGYSYNITIVSESSRSYCEVCYIEYIVLTAKLLIIKYAK